jgi:hypothetical protein
MHMWHHVTNHLIISNDKDSNSENRIKLRVRDNSPGCFSLLLIFSLSSVFSLSHLSSSLHLLLVYISGSAATPSHIQRGPSVAIPSVRRP